jgi:D-glucosaminate-6-phosphate ammonia-lyase
MPSIYETLGIETLINAWAPMTRFGGGIMRPEVAEAMSEATQSCVDIADLQGRASAVIVDLTGAEAGFVTAGASAAILLGTAACLTGWDPSRMERLPDTRAMKNEVIVARGQRNSYDHAVRAAGAVLVEVGVADRIMGLGVRDVEPWEYEAAIGDRTAAIYFVARPEARPALEDVVVVARKAGLPVIVDAAAELPPAANLRRFIAAGADLVAFSGGKAIGGPQGSGLLCGRRDLVGPALLQQLDLDYAFADWEPPANLVTKDRLPGVPRNGIGRSCKVAKEQIVGLLTALRLFVAEDDAQRVERSRQGAAALLRGIAGVPWLDTEIVPDPENSDLAVVRLQLDQTGAGLAAADLVRQLVAGRPRIEINPWRLDEGVMLLAPGCLSSGDTEVIARRLSEILAK